MTDILKLEELPNDGLDTSWGALWLGIRTFFGFNVDYPKAQGPSRPQVGCKFAQVGRSWRQSGPRTGQVGGKTATSTPKLTPRWAKSAPRQTK